MAKHSTGSVRMGPISLVSLVIVLSLAVMTMLSVTTTRAMQSSTERHVTATTDIYACEQAGQEFLSKVDAQLAGVRKGTASKAAAMAALRKAGNALVDGLDVVGISSAVNVAEKDNADTDVTATFVTENDRRLTVTLSISAKATYKITSWKTTTFWNNYTSNDTLWSGENTD